MKEIKSIRVFETHVEREMLKTILKKTFTGILAYSYDFRRAQRNVGCSVPSLWSSNDLIAFNEYGNTKGGYLGCKIT